MVKFYVFLTPKFKCTPRPINRRFEQREIIHKRILDIPTEDRRKAQESIAKPEESIRKPKTNSGKARKLLENKLTLKTN